MLHVGAVVFSQNLESAFTFMVFFIVVLTNIPGERMKSTASVDGTLGERARELLSTRTSPTLALLQPRAHLSAVQGVGTTSEASKPFGVDPKQTTAHTVAFIP